MYQSVNRRTDSICAQFLWKPKTAFKNKVYSFKNTRIKQEKIG